MLTSISAISLICLVLAYSGWDSVDPPPTYGIHNTDKPFKFDTYEFLDMKGYILQWFLIHDDQYEYNTDCCGIPLRYPEKHESMKLFQQNNMAEKRLLPDDPLYFLSEHLSAVMKNTSTETTSRMSLPHVAVITSTSPGQENKKTLITTITGIQQDIEESATGKQTRSNRKPTSGTLNPVQNYVYSVYNQDSDNTTTTTTEDKYFIHLSERLYKRFTVMNDMFNDIRGFIFSDNESLTRQFKNTTHDECDDDVQNGHDDDEVALVVIPRLCFLAVVYQFRRMRRLTCRKLTKVKKGFTKTPILYKNGKYLELGLSKYFRHLPIVISQTPPSAPSLLSMEDMIKTRLDTTDIVGVDLKSHDLSTNPVSARISKSCSCLPFRVSRNDVVDRPRPFLSLPMLPIVSTWLQEEMTSRFPGMITKKPATEGRNQNQNASAGLTKVETISTPCFWKPKTLGAALVYLSQELPSLGSNTSFYEKITLLISGYAVNRWTTDNQRKGNLPSQD